jgi:hypothetical protein
VATREGAGFLVAAFLDEWEHLFNCAEAQANQRSIIDCERAKLDILSHGHLGKETMTLRHLNGSERQNQERMQAFHRAPV